jgi:hypothetical protein
VRLCEVQCRSWTRDSSLLCTRYLLAYPWADSFNIKALRLLFLRGVYRTALLRGSVIVLLRGCKHVPRQLVRPFIQAWQAPLAILIAGVADTASFCCWLLQDLQRAQRPRPLQQERQNLVPGKQCARWALSACGQVVAHVDKLLVAFAGSGQCW